MPGATASNRGTNVENVYTWRVGWIDMAQCPVCKCRIRLFCRGFKPWHCHRCRTRLQLGRLIDLVHPMIAPFVMLVPFLRDLVIVECSPDYCATCHYNLTGNVSGICPECGTPLPANHPNRGK